MTKKKQQIRKAKVKDVPRIQELVNFYANRKEMLPRSLNELYENLSEIFVVDDGGKIIGCCQLHVTWEDLAEVKALAVSLDYFLQGWGRKLVQTSIREGKKLGIKKVFALTFKPDFFEKLGFVDETKSDLEKKKKDLDDAIPEIRELLKDSKKLETTLKNRIVEIDDELSKLTRMEQKKYVTEDVLDRELGDFFKSVLEKIEVLDGKVKGVEEKVRRVR